MSQVRSIIKKQIFAVSPCNESLTLVLLLSIHWSQLKPQRTDRSSLTVQDLLFNQIMYVHVYMCCSVPPYVKASRQRSRDAAGPNAYPPCFCCVQRGMAPGVLRMVQYHWSDGLVDLCWPLMLQRAQAG